MSSDNLDSKFIPPDYTDAVERDIDKLDAALDDDDDLHDVVDDHEDFEMEALAEAQKKENEKIMNTSSLPFSPSPVPSTIPAFGTPPPTSWGNSQPSTGASSFWAQGGSIPRTSPWSPPSNPIQSSPFGGGGSSWSSSPSFGGQRSAIPREKKVIFCDFLDCIAETLDSQGRPGLRPRDIYDLRAKLDVWAKIAAFNPERIFMIVPMNMVPSSTNGINAWEVTLSYFCCCMSSFLHIPFGNCIVIKQKIIGHPKEYVLNAIMDDPNFKYTRQDCVLIGSYSGVNGLSDADQLAAKSCKIDYIDLIQLLSMI